MVMITCEFKGDKHDYGQFFSEMQRIAGSENILQVLESTWVLDAGMSAGDVYYSLRPYISDGDRFIISDVTDRMSRQGWFAKKSWNWIRMHAHRVQYTYQISYDKKDGNDDSNEILKDILKFLRDHCGVANGGVRRPSETSLVFYSDELPREVLDLFKETFDSKIFYLFSRISQMGGRSLLAINENEELSKNLNKIWDDLPK